MQAQRHVFLHIAGVEHRHHGCRKHMVALVRQGRAVSAVVVTGHHQHAAMTRGASVVHVFHHVDGAVHARAFGIPESKHAVIRRAACELDLLRAPDRGERQVFVDTGLKADVVRLQMLLGFPKSFIQTTQRRATVAGHKPCGVQTCGLVAQALNHG